MKMPLPNNSTMALTVRKNYSLAIVKKVATRSMVISSKALFAAFVLTFVNLFV